MRPARPGVHDAGQRLDGVPATLIRAGQLIAAELATFLPGTAARISRPCTPGAGGRLPSPSPVFTRLL